jgi:hypothetical protein
MAEITDKIACGAYCLLDSSNVRSGKSLAHDNFSESGYCLQLTEYVSASQVHKGRPRPLGGATITPAN